MADDREAAISACEQSLADLGELCGGQGDYGTAEPLIEEALQVMDELGEDYMKAEALRDLGQLALARGDPTRAGRLLDQTLMLILPRFAYGAVTAHVPWATKLPAPAPLT